MATISTPINTTSWSYPNSTVIQQASLSFESILNDLVTWAQAKPNGASWLDWYESSDGQIIAEWISGLATFRAFHDALSVRESQLDNAQIPSSVYNLAFNKGLLLPPAMAPEISWNITTPSIMSFSIGDFVGTLGTYDCFSLEDKTINGTDTLLIVVGRQNTFSQAVSGLQAFQTFSYTTTDDYFASQLETFAVDSVAIPMLTDVDYLHSEATNFVLRRTMPSQSRVYVGNGIVGWLPTGGAAQNVTYTALSYSDQDMSTALAGVPVPIQSSITVNSSTIMNQPSDIPGIEYVRQMAVYYPVDGRCVTDSDYDVIITKNFGGYITDIYCWNSNPEEQVYILKNSNFGADGSPQETQVLGDITALVDSKRALGMEVLYNLKDPEAGLIFVTAMKIPEAQYSDTLINNINSYLNSLTFQFQRVPVTITTETLAIQLSAQFAVPIYPNATDTVSALATDFFAQMAITCTSF